MIDFLLGLYLAGLAVRGWLRGFVRELFDLAGLVIGVVVAFRLSGPVGGWIADRFDATPEWAQLGSGIALFFLVGTGMALVAHQISRVARLPGLNLANRLGGITLAVGWGLALVLIVASLLRALPLPPAVDDALEGSEVVEAVAGPGSPAEEWFTEVAGDDMIDAILALERLVGDRRVVLEEEERVEIPAAEASELSVDRAAAEQIAGLVNDARLAEGLAPLAWSEGLAAVAEAHATEMYRQGYVSHVSPTTGTVGDRVEAAGIRLRIVGENLALAPTPRAVHRGLMDSPGHRANILREEYNRVGVGAVRGPLGLMVVEVFGG